ncbi:MAG TPA: glutathione peroxidase [Methylophilus sp.]
MRAILAGWCLITGVSVVHAECLPIYQHQFKTLQGETIDLCQYQNKPILVVNTASKCGFTPQFEALEALYAQYKEKGLLVVGFPSNDFRQEPGNNKQIGDFCKLTYAVKFPMAEKSSVTGENANPFYQQLIRQTGQAPQWNFYKYVILPGGQKIYSFNSMTRPESDEIMSKLKPYLK